jgi:multidrug efflux pump subunit AcrA (membrane-fusion protein)
MIAARAYLYCAALVVAIGLGLTARAHWIGAGEHRVQVKWDAQKATDLAASLRLERERNADMLARVNNSERTAYEQDRLQSLRAARDAALAAERRSLHSAIASLNQRAVPAPADAAGIAALAGQAATARDLLGQCAERYSRLASTAEQLRDQVIGLQADAHSVCRAGSASSAPGIATAEPVAQ